MALEFLLRDKKTVSNPLLPRLYGRGSTRGIPCFRKLLDGRMRFLVLLAAGGRYGCDGLDKVLVSGEEFPEYDGATRQWRFRPGTRSTGYGDALQGRPEFFPELDLVFSGKSYLEGILPDGVEDLSKLAIFMRGLKVMHYELDTNGNLKETAAAFSANNALCSLDVLREVGKFPVTRFNRHAPTWTEFVEVCDEQLEWDRDGAGDVIDVPRYDCHVPFPTQIDPTTAFEAIMLRAPGASWQDVNGGIKILADPDRGPVHTFSRSNIVKGGLSGAPKPPEEQPNFFIYSYNDIESDVYEVKFIFEDRAELRDQADGVLNVAGPIPLGLMYESLAQRIMKCQVRQLVDAPFTVGLRVRGFPDSYHVAKCDNVEVGHDRIGIAPALARVVRENFEPRGDRLFDLRRTTTDYYRDSDHGPKQNN